jgi:serine/threonine protein kinase/Flp pilus assembly protein TadD
MSPSLRPGSSEGTDALLADLIEEITDKLRTGAAVDVEVYVARYPERAEQIRELLPALELLAVAGSSPANGEPAPGGPPLPSGVLGDFRLLREVGRGGMGIVYEAEQLSLRRRVALKVLPFAGMLDPRALQRFHNEAQAAACLHHTNIVPVHFVGSERGVNFYAMQFIDGQTLAALIEQQRQGATTAEATTAYQPPGAPAAAPEETTVAQAATRSGSGSKRGREDFRQVAQLGVQAAEALDHAHQAGIVHRDIKPANLMLDVRGNLWVTDFGLAHVQHGEASLTMTGDLVGTLRYMSPEQALAKRVVIDHRTDVYSLGATLYELLTLRPAFDGKDRQELLRQIAFEEPPQPRRLDRGIPAELETIVLKAMEKNPAERYGTAQELADDLRRWLEDQPIRARRPSLVQRARKWGRRHKALVRAMTALVLVLLLVGGALLWREQLQRAAVERGAESSLERAEFLQERGRWDEALAVLALTEGQLEGHGLGTLRRRVAQKKQDVEMRGRLENAFLQKAASGKATPFDDAGADRLYAEAFAGYGLDVAALSSEEVAQRVRASAISTHLIAGLDDWAGIKDRLRKGSGTSLRAAADLADDDPWRRGLREAATRGDGAALERLAEQPGARSQPAVNQVLLASALGGVRRWGAAARLLRRAQQDHPADFWINFKLAYSLSEHQPPDWTEVVAFLRAALALRPQSPVAWNNLGVVLHEQKRLGEAVAACRQAIKLKPDYAEAHYNLGNALYDQKKPDEAVAAYKKATKFKPDYAEAYNNLSLALYQQNKLDEAVAACHKAIRIKDDHANAYNNLGTALSAQKKWKEAEAAYRKAFALKPDYAEAYSNLGAALLDQGRPAEAEAALRRAIALRPRYGLVHYNLGNALRDQKRLAEALAAFRRADQLRPNHPLIRNNLRQTERLLELDKLFPALLAGKVKPRSPQEQVELAFFCVACKEHPRTAVGLFADAFRADPKLADDLKEQRRYNAACAAARAGCGQGKDADQSDAREWTRLRRQALDWLRADLAAYRRLLDKERDKASPLVRERMQHWQQEPDFSGVRGEALDKLPEAERQEWQKLWQEVKMLRQDAADPPKPAKPGGP